MIGRRQKPPEAETVAGLNVTATVFLLVLVFGMCGGFVAISNLEAPYKILLFVLGAIGTTGSFLGTRKFHLRRVAATGDPRTTVYSALTIYSMLFFAILFFGLALVIVGRATGLIAEEPANFVSYFFITDVVVLLFLLGVACVYDMRNPGLLARRIYLWPWEYMLQSIGQGPEPPPPNDPDATRNDADRNEENYDRETDQGETPEEDRT